MKADNEDFYRPSGGTAVADDTSPQPGHGGRSAEPPHRGSFSWTASEYIEHDRGTDWYVVLSIGTAAVAGVTYLLTKEIFATGIIVAVGVIVAVYARQKPRQLEYELSDSGLRIGDKLYPFSHFRSFALVKEGLLNSIQLMPLKKFTPPVSAYYDAGDEEKITDIIGDHLPFEDAQPSSIDRLSRRLKF